MLYLILAGVASGILSGMGMGGGIILIPVLTLLLGYEQKSAQGMNLVYFIPTAVLALIVHIGKKSISFKTALSLIIPGVLGAGAGAMFAMRFPSNLLRIIFGVFLIIVGCYEIKLAFNKH